jgi:GTP diphosphokinase / guanosine-3',5'-bis(diphosphate) 3'-diphosphatase
LELWSREHAVSDLLLELSLSVNVAKMWPECIAFTFSMEEVSTAVAILKALHFAARKHRDQRRKDIEASPYINHPIEVAELLARIGMVSDPVVLQAAILHDTIEDTQTTPEELEEVFGPEVSRLVLEVTDDKSLPKAERKRLQVLHASQISERARQIKIADKISNVQSVTKTPPADWSLERRKEYLNWTEQVVAGCRGPNEPLEKFYDQVLESGRKILNAGK